MKTLDISVKDHIASVTFSRPEQSNSIILDVFHELIQAAETIANDDTVRVVIITGAGKHFCAGLDRSLFPQSTGPVDWFEEHANTPLDQRGANLFQHAVTVWQDISVPVIAAVNGAALGGGCQIALGADIRIADASTRMSLMEAHWGLIPDMAASELLPTLMPRDVAAELLLSARTLNAAEAKEAGLVTRITDNCQSAAQELAENIAAKSPRAIRAAKQLYQSAWQNGGESLLPFEAKLQQQLIGTDEQIEAVTANLAQRPPRFKN